MIGAEQHQKLADAFERIEGTILPCISMMLQTLLDASRDIGQTDPKVLVAELQTLAAELEELTRSVELYSPVQLDPGAYRTSARS
jgi:hypothetical protein